MREPAAKGATAGAFAAWGALLIALVGGTSGCGSSENPPTAAVSSPQVAKRVYAKATLQRFGDGKTAGTAVFSERSGQHILEVDLRGLDPTRRQSQYYLWQLEAPKDRVSLETPDDMVNLASYRVGDSGDLAVELEPTPKAFIALENGHLTHFLVTRIDSPTDLQDSIVKFDNTGSPPDLGTPIAEGAFSGPLVGAAEPQ